MKPERSQGANKMKHAGANPAPAQAKAGGNPPKYNAILHIGLPPAVANALEQAAADNLETVSAVARRFLVWGLRSEGRLPVPPANTTGVAA